MRRCLILLHAVAAAKSCDESRLVRRPDYAERLLRAAIQCNATTRIEPSAAVANLAVAGTGSQTLADALQAWRGVVGKRARPAGVPRLPRRRLLLGEAVRRGGARVTPRARAHRLISHHDHRITVDHLLRTTKRWSTALDTFGEPQEKIDVFLLTLRDPVRRFQSGWRYRPDFRGFGTLENLLREWRKRLGDGPRPAFPDGLASSFRRLNTAVNQYFATPQLSYLVGSACACRRGQVRLRVLCTESLRRDLPALAAELGARASHRHSNLRTTRRPRRNATATVSAETAAWLRDMYREDVALHKYYCS